MLTLADLASRLRVSRSTAEGWITSGLLAAFNAAPVGSKRKQYRITEEDLARFQASRAFGQPATKTQEFRKTATII